MKIRFLEDGRWAEPNNAGAPQIEVKAGGVYDVSNELANLALACGKAKALEVPAPPKMDKVRAEGNPAKKDKRRAKNK